MSIEDLKADLEQNLKEAKALASSMGTTSLDLAKHMVQTMWPFLENVVGELEDLDAGVSDLYHGAEDILQPETGKLFATVIAGAAGLIGELEKRLVLPVDDPYAVAIREWRTLAAEAGTALTEIVVPELEDTDEDDDDEDEDDDETEEG